MGKKPNPEQFPNVFSGTRGQMQHFFSVTILAYSGESVGKGIGPRPDFIPVLLQWNHTVLMLRPAVDLSILELLLMLMSILTFLKSGFLFRCEYSAMMTVLVSPCTALCWKPHLPGSPSQELCLGHGAFGRDTALSSARHPLPLMQTCATKSMWHTCSSTKSQSQLYPRAIVFSNIELNVYIYQGKTNLHPGEVSALVGLVTVWWKGVGWHIQELN